MAFLLSLSWKNLSRYRRRTIITASAIGFGLLMCITMVSLLKGLEIDSQRNLWWYESASARIENAAAWAEKDSMPVGYVIEDSERVIEALSGVGIAAVPRTAFLGDLAVYQDPYPADGSMTVRVFAVDAERDDDVFRFPDAVVEGRWLEPGEDGVVLGGWLAEDLGAEVGYPITIQARTRYGSYVVLDFTVVGIVDCPNPYINRGTLFIPLDTADFYLEMGGTVTEIDMRYPENAGLADFNARATAAAESAGLAFVGDPATLEAGEARDDGRMVLVDWETLGKDFLEIAKGKSMGSSTILGLMFIIALVGISNTMLMAVLERFREIGMMRALGMRSREILLSFVFEAAGIGFIGATVGLAFGLLLNLFLVNVGIDLTFMMRDFDMGYRITGLMRGAWVWPSFLMTYLSGIFLPMIIAVIPARRALRKQITDCLRNK